MAAGMPSFCDARSAREGNSFNEAAAEWPREFGNHHGRQRRLLASMRPRPNGRGNCPIDPGFVPPAKGFNEAAAEWPRECTMADANRVIWGMLQ